LYKGLNGAIRRWTTLDALETTIVILKTSAPYSVLSKVFNSVAKAKRNTVPAVVQAIKAYKLS
jgi:hypothetical protein